MNLMNTVYSATILSFVTLAAGVIRKADTKRQQMGNILQFKPRTPKPAQPEPVPVEPENIPDVEGALSGLRRMFTEEEIRQIHKDLGGDD